MIVKQTRSSGYGFQSLLYGDIMMEQNTNISQIQKTFVIFYEINMLSVMRIMAANSIGTLYCLNWTHVVI